jgi:tartrate-resistant acid phosphatase type 5
MSVSEPLKDFYIFAPMMKTPLFFLLIILISISACSKLPIDASLLGAPVSRPADSTTFAIIGDYGEDSKHEAEVAQMVKSWNPEFIITVGDNNYPLGSAGTIVNNVGKHYCDYIYNPSAPADRICNGRAASEKVNRFFPSPGNHDNYSVPAIRPYLDYFTLPGDERNYEFTWGPVYFLSLNTNKSGHINSTTRDWLKNKLALTSGPFKLVYFHHPPYSPGPHGSAQAMQFPYAEWGADAVVGGHEHFYARITDNHSTKPLYLIIGNSGNENLYNCNANPLDPNRFTVNMCDNARFGAVKVSATTTRLVFEYFTTDDLLHPRDVVILNK